MSILFILFISLFFFICSLMISIYLLSNKEKFYNYKLQGQPANRGMKFFYGLPHKKVDVTNIVKQKWIKNTPNTSGGPEIIIPVNDVVRKNQLGIDPIPNVVKYIFIEEGKEKPHIVTHQQQLNINLNYSKNNDSKVILTKRYKHCVIFSYCERKKSHLGCNPIINLDYFCKNGVHNNPDVFYIFVINHYQCHINIPQLPNVRIYTRQNSGRCQGAWRFGISKINVTQFDYFIFMNDIIKGPFINKKNWYHQFGNMIDSKVKLSSLSNNIPCPKYWPPNKNFGYFVTEMLWCVDRTGLDIISKNLWNNITDLKFDEEYKKSRFYYIFNYEMGLTREIEKQNYKVKGLYHDTRIIMRKPDNIDKLFLKK